MLTVIIDIFYTSIPLPHYYNHPNQNKTLKLLILRNGNGRLINFLITCQVLRVIYPSRITFYIISTRAHPTGISDQTTCINGLMILMNIDHLSGHVSMLYNKKITLHYLLLNPPSIPICICNIDHGQSQALKSWRKNLVAGAR